MKKIFFAVAFVFCVGCNSSSDEVEKVHAVKIIIQRGKNRDVYSCPPGAIIEVWLSKNKTMLLEVGEP